MVDDGCEGLELGAAIHLGTMVEGLLVRWRVEMLFEARELVEFARAEVALVRVTIPRLFADLVLSRSRPPDKPLGDHALWILGPDKSVDLVAVEALAAGASSRLEVVRDAGGRGEVPLAKGALDGSASMDARVEVLEGVGSTMSLWPSWGATRASVSS